MNITDRHHTLIIFDWDDTCFPTKWFMRNHLQVNTTGWLKYKSYFDDLDMALSRMLLTYSEYGTVVIVTNALSEWVYMSASILPTVSDVLQHIKIISARKLYQDKSTTMDEWKRQAFNNELGKLMTKKDITNIISIGDAEYEYNALVALYAKHHKQNKIMKSIRFVSDPSQHVLLDQIKVCTDAARDVVHKSTHLDLQFRNH